VAELIGAHDDAGMRARAVGEAQEEGAHCKRPGFAGPQRARDRGQIFVARMDQLFGGWRGRQSGCEHIAALAVGCLWLRLLLDRQRYGALHQGQCDPVREAQGVGDGR